jgi:cell wall-associated NlpC family hydrolase
MKKTIAACALVLLAVPAVVAAGLGTVVLPLAARITVPAGGPFAAGSQGGGLPVPAAMVALYARAALSCPGLPWSILAAIGTVESDNGTSSVPGVRSGANHQGAEGPMQFEPATFAAYDEPVPPGGADPPSPYDPVDAVYAAARMLCANGASQPGGLERAIFAYNHSTPYVQEVVALASRYAVSIPADPGEVALAWALGQVGTPYRWGGETPGVGFDCSGLVQAAYLAAGVGLPRTAQDQFDAGPQLPPSTPLEPGDLVFFGAGPRDVTHVGIYVGSSDGQAYMVDAPYTGTSVRVEPFSPNPGSDFGSDVLVGATRLAT